MNELYRELLDHLRGMWHRRWIGLGVAWLAVVIGVAVVYRIPERYEATARVYVDTESILKPLLAGLALQPNLDQQVALMSRTLISRPNVEKLVRMADLDLKAKTQSDRDELIDGVIKTISLTGNITSNLYVISYRDPNPEQARRVVQSLLSIFVESSLGDKKQDTQTAVKFVDDQIARYEQALKTAEVHQPQLGAARSQVRVGTARVGEARSGYLPRIDAQAQYQRSTANFTLNPALANSNFRRRSRSWATPATSFLAKVITPVSARWPTVIETIGGWDFGHARR